MDTTATTTIALLTKDTEGGIAPLLSLQEVAAAIGMSPKTLRHWAAVGKLPWPLIRIGRRTLRVRALDLADWIDSGGATPVPRSRRPGRPRKQPKG